VLVDGGQFTGMTVGQIATELAKPFNLEVVVETDGPPEPEVQVQQGETCFALVERLSRLQELLVTDDAEGRLVLCRAGSRQAAAALHHGRNIKSASADLDNSQRFSEYIVKAQRPGNNKRAADDAISDPWGNVDPVLTRLRNIPNVSERYRQRMTLLRRGGGKTNPKTLTQIGAAVRDEGVTRYRPHLIVAEAQADDAHAQKRAEWEMRRRLARAIRATIQVNGWRQQDGRLWTTNEMVDVTAPWLALDRELIIAQVQYSFDDGGEMTGLELTLPDAFLPEPKRKGKRHHEREERAAESSRRPGRKKAGKATDPWAHVVPTT
jgi:prophage tail gpP-like protein